MTNTTALRSLLLFTFGVSRGWIWVFHCGDNTYFRRELHWHRQGLKTQSSDIAAMQADICAPQRCLYRPSHTR